MSLVSGRQTINAQACADVVTLARQVQQVVEALGNPGPVIKPDDIVRSPCGELAGNAFIRLVDGVPTLVYVDAEGVCQTVPTSGSPADEPIISVVQVNSVDPGGVTVNWVSNITGTGSGVAVPLYNPWGSTYTAGQLLLAVKITSGPQIGKYVAPPDREGTGGGPGGGGGGTSEPEIIRFELTANKQRSQTEVAAKNRADDSDIEVSDPLGDFFGETGFLGYAWKNGSEYRILTMDGWTRLLLVQLKETVAGTGGLYDCDVLANLADAPFASIKPPTSIEVYFRSELVSPVARLGDNPIYLAALDTDDDGAGGYYYRAVAKIWPRVEYVRIRGQAVGAVTRAMASFPIDNVEPLIGPSPVGNAATQVTVQTESHFRMVCPDNAIVYAFWDARMNAWNGADAANFLHLLKGLEGWSGGVDQSLLHDQNTDPKWKDDGICP